MYCVKNSKLYFYDGTTKKILEVKTPGVSKIVRVYYDSKNVYLLTNQRELFQFSENGVKDGKPSLSNKKLVFSGIEHISSNGPVIFVADGNIYVPNNKKYPFQVTDDNRFARASMGGDHIVAIDLEGNLWAQGDNSYGQCGFSNNLIQNLPQFQQITSGFKFVDVQCIKNSTVARDEEGEIFICGDPQNNVLLTQIKPEHLTKISLNINIVSFFVDEGAIFLIDTNRQLYAYGFNSIFSQYEYDEEDSITEKPIKIPTHSIPDAIRTDNFGNSILKDTKGILYFLDPLKRMTIKNDKNGVDRIVNEAFPY